MNSGSFSFKEIFVEFFFKNWPGYFSGCGTAKALLFYNIGDLVISNYNSKPFIQNQVSVSNYTFKYVHSKNSKLCNFFKADYY